eukprot:383312_1
MAFLYQDGDGISPYIKARQRFYSPEGWHQLITSIQTSSTLYIGNLSFFTEELQIYTLFSLVAPVKRVIMGLNKVTKSPCGFCFVEYFTNEEAVLARRYLDHMKLDGRIIRVDMDPGFEEGRQYGRGKSGGQVRDFHRRTTKLIRWVPDHLHTSANVSLLLAHKEHQETITLIRDSETKNPTMMNRVNRMINCILIIQKKKK